MLVVLVPTGFHVPIGDRPVHGAVPIGPEGGSLRASAGGDRLACRELSPVTTRGHHPRERIAVYSRRVVQNRPLEPAGLHIYSATVFHCVFCCGDTTVRTHEETFAMKRKQLVIVSALALVVAFVIAGVLYKRHRAEKTKAMAEMEDSPLNRSYAMSMGPKDAKVVIVEFFDPGCETCRAFAKPVKRILSAHPDKVRLVKRYAPFHHGADKVVQILEAARLQGKYWEALDVMFEHQPVWASHHHPQPEKIWQFLPQAGLDIARLRQDMNDSKIVDIVKQDIEDGKALGVRKTPSFFVNGKPLQRFGYEPLKTLVAQEVARQYGGD